MDDGLLLAAGYEVQEGTVAHIGVVTRREGRSAGCGRRVVSAIASGAMATERYARTLAARTKGEGK